MPTVKPLPDAFLKESLCSLIATSRNVYEISNPESLMFKPWFKPWAPQPTITIFFPNNAVTPSSNSEASINLHFPNCSN